PAFNVLCAYHVTVTVNESQDDKRIEQGSFYRRWPFALDGKKVDPNAELFGPEIVGRVLGEIDIGGFDDQGKIRFKSFPLNIGASHQVQLASDANVVLEKLDRHPDQPRWIEVNLRREEEQASKTRTTWLLEVVVPGRPRLRRLFF